MTDAALAASDEVLVTLFRLFNFLARCLLYIAKRWWLIPVAATILYALLVIGLGIWGKLFWDDFKWTELPPIRDLESAFSGGVSKGSYKDKEPECVSVPSSGECVLWGKRQPEGDVWWCGQGWGGGSDTDAGGKHEDIWSSGQWFHGERLGKLTRC